MRRYSGWFAILLVFLVAFSGCVRNSDEIDGPTPSLQSMDPALVCVDQGARQVAMLGDGLAPLMRDAAKDDPFLELPAVFLQQTSDIFGVGTADVPDEVQIPPEDVSWTDQQNMSVLVASEMAVGIYRARVMNGSGQEVMLDSALAIVPPPVVEAVEPDLTCVAQAAQQVVVSGQAFLEVDGVMPVVTIGELELTPLSAADCTALAAPADHVRLCTSLTVEIPAAGLPPDLYQVVVTNPEPAGCTSSDPVNLLVVPPPVVDTAAPDLLCVDEQAREVVLSGQGFIDLDGQLPQVTVADQVFDASSVSGCTDLEGPAAPVRSCTGLVFEIPQAGLVPGAHSLVVTNPAPVDCSSEETVTLALVPAPTLDGVEPEFFCGAQQDAALTLFGTGFIQVGSEQPQVELGGEVLPVDSMADCQAVAGTTLDASVCTELLVTLPAGDRPSGWQAISVENPQPAGCSLDDDQAIFLVGPPRIDSVGPATPCDQNPTELVVLGDGFLEQDGQLPVVLVGGTEATVLTANCSPMPEYTGVNVCTQLNLTVAAGSVGPGDTQIQVTNPGSPVCQTEATMHIGPPPVVSSISPLELCASGGVVTVNGQGFSDGAVVQISNSDDSQLLETTFVDENTLQATVPDPTPTGLYDVTVINPDGCQGTLPAILDITPQPIVFFVDPTVMYNGITLQATVYTSGILGTVSDVQIYPTGQPGQALSLSFSVDPQGRVQAVVPSGLDAGSYDLSVADDRGCLGYLVDALEIVSELTVAIDRVELPFGWTDSRTGVNIYSPDDPSPLVNFQATPRFYLNPQNATVDTLASELRSTAFVSVTRASSAVPANMPEGMYDLIVTNPDGGVGLLTDAFQVTPLPPPLISDLAPASLVNQDIQSTTISGSNFRNPTLETSCLQPDGSTAELVGSVESFDATSIAVEYNFTAQTIQDGSVCVLKVINDDGTYALYSALGVTNPSLNLEHFSATTDLIQARRAPCVAAGEASPGARFVYTIGGDDGVSGDTDATTYYDSVELAAIDPYGDLDNWSTLPYTLPAGRSFHSCQSIGRYIFVAGGTEGSGAIDTVLRARILDPLDSPQVADVDLFVDPESTQSLLPGRYSYRVSAIRAVDDPDNPDGETLPSDPFQIQVPDIEAGLTLTISWSAVPGAAGYRVYRTPDPDLASGNEVLIAELGSTTLTFSDDGSATPGTAQALPIGALGKFAQLPSMATAREGAAIALAAEPTDSSLVYLYLLGGRDDTGTALDSVEWLSVQTAGPDSQVVGSGWLAGSASIGTARWQLGAFAANHVSAPDLLAAGETWIYVGGGIRANLSSLEPDVVGMKVAASGVLGEGVDELFSLDTMQPFRAGYTPVIFNNQLFAFGGYVGSAASRESSSIEMCGLGAGACGSAAVPEPPELSNWNSLGIDLTVARYLAGGATVSAFIFLVGGIDDSFPAVPLAATEKTLW